MAFGICRSSFGHRDERVGQWVVEFVFIFLFIVNLLNYIDRGIIPGAEEEFSAFVKESLHTSRPNLFIGLLQSSFIVGFSIAALYFGHAIHYYNPFKMVGLGLSIWVLATLLSGLSRHVGKYEFLFFARMLSGVGEASFQCVAPPFISDLGGDASGRWLAVFYTAIPLGTAIGYPWGSLFSQSPFGWQAAFYVESLLMLPIACAFLFALPFTWRPERAPVDEYEVEDDGDESDEDDDDHTAFINSLRPPGGEDEQAYQLLNQTRAPEEDEAQYIERSRHVSLKDEFLAIIKRPIYLLTVFGYAGNTATMIGVSTFGSALLLEFGYFKQESTASTVFGIALSLAGLLGTPLGGFLIDRQKFRSEEAKLTFLCRQNFFFALCGMLFVCLSCFIYTRIYFFTFFVLGALFLFTCTAGINLAAMLAVPPANRSFSIAFNTLCIHALGDVPSPIVVGALLDTLAPACSEALKDKA